MVGSPGVQGGLLGGAGEAVLFKGESRFCRQCGEGRQGLKFLSAHILSNLHIPSSSSPFSPSFLPPQPPFCSALIVDLISSPSHSSLLFPYEVGALPKAFSFLEPHLIFGLPRVCEGPVSGSFGVLATFFEEIPMSAFINNDTSLFRFGFKEVTPWTGGEVAGGLGGVTGEEGLFLHTFWWVADTHLLPVKERVFCVGIKLGYLGRVGEQEVCGYHSVLKFGLAEEADGDGEMLWRDLEGEEEREGEEEEGVLDFGKVVMNHAISRYLLVCGMTPVNTDLSVVFPSDFGSELKVKLDPLGQYPFSSSLSSSPPVFSSFPSISWNIFQEGEGKDRLVELSNETTISLSSNHCSLLALELTAVEEKEGAGSFLICSEYSCWTIRYQYKSIGGNLYINPTPLQFNPSFPGRVTQKSLLLRSTFLDPLVISYIRSNDSRIIPALLNDTLLPHKRTQVGYIIFDPSKVDHEEVEKGGETGGNLSPPGQGLTQQDIQEVERRKMFWEGLQRSGETDIKATIEIGTNVSQVFLSFFSFFTSFFPPSHFFSFFSRSSNYPLLLLSFDPLSLPKTSSTFLLLKSVPKKITSNTSLSTTLPTNTFMCNSFPPLPLFY